MGLHQFQHKPTLFSNSTENQENDDRTPDGQGNAPEAKAIDTAQPKRRPDKSPEDGAEDAQDYGQQQRVLLLQDIARCESTDQANDQPAEKATHRDVSLFSNW
jgi:hypothetical protein